MNEQTYPIWLGVLTGAVVVLIIGVVIGIAALASDVAQLEEQMTALKSGSVSNGARASDGALALPPVGSALKPTPMLGSAFNAQIDGLSVTSNTLVVSLTVQFSGPADLLYQPPVVRGASGQTYAVAPESLKSARFAFLDLTTQGQATAVLVFQPAPVAKEALTLVFNPTMPAGDAVAPRIEVVLRGEG